MEKAEEVAKISMIATTKAAENDITTSEDVSITIQIGMAEEIVIDTPGPYMLQVLLNCPLSQSLYQSPSRQHSKKLIIIPLSNLFQVPCSEEYLLSTTSLGDTSKQEESV